MTHAGKIEKLRQLAAAGNAPQQIAEVLGWKQGTVRTYASAHKIKFQTPRRLPSVPLREGWDWSREMPRLRANVRAAVEQIKAEPTL